MQEKLQHQNQCTIILLLYKVEVVLRNPKEYEGIYVLGHFHLNVVLLCEVVRHFYIYYILLSLELRSLYIQHTMPCRIQCAGAICTFILIRGNPNPFLPPPYRDTEKQSQGLRSMCP